MNENDRELLELAAKAAGLPVAAVHRPLLKTGVWNPLESNNEALWLATKLDILVRTDFIKLLSELYRIGMPKPEATRRAIVTIAAELGRAMP